MRSGGAAGPLGLMAVLMIVLELMVWRPRAVLWLIPVWLILFGTLGIRASREQSGVNWPQVILIWLSLPATAALALLLPDTGLIHVYFLIIVGLFGWWIKVGIWKQASPFWNGTAALLLLLFNTGLILAWEFLLDAPDLLALSLLWIVTAALSCQGLVRTGGRRALVPSLVLALILTELMWLLLYWPIHWLAITGIIATVYYVCFHLVTSSWRRSISWGIAAEYGLVGALAVGIILWVTQWT